MSDYDLKAELILVIREECQKGFALIREELRSLEPKKASVPSMEDSLSALQDLTSALKDLGGSEPTPDQIKNLQNLMNEHK